MVREKHRWILIEIIGDSISKDELIKAINQKIYELYGTVYGAKVRYRLVDFDEKENIGIIRINLDAIDLFRATLPFIKEVSGKKVLINDVLVSGTINALRKKMSKKSSWSRIWKEKNLSNESGEE